MKRSNVIQNIGWREKKPGCEQNNDFMQQLKKLAGRQKENHKGTRKRAIIVIVIATIDKIHHRKQLHHCCHGDETKQAHPILRLAA